MKKYKAILFDADQTLLDFKRSEAVAFRETAAYFGVECTDELLEMYSASNYESWLLLEKGEITKKRLMTYRFERFFERAGLVEDPQVWNDYYKKRLAEAGFLLPFAKEILDYSFVHWDLYLVTNGISSVQNGRLDKLGIRPYFKDIFISENIGAEKPSEAYFDGVFSAMQHTKEESLIVGDSLTSDIAGGLRYGIDTCFINWKGVESCLSPTYTVANLRELYALLEKLGCVEGK